MKKLIPVLLVLFSLQAKAQFTPKQITINLTPIVVENGKYFYDGKRVKFEEFVFPMLALNDKILNRKIKFVHTFEDIQKLVLAAPLIIYLILNNNQSNYFNNFDATRNLIFSALIASLSLRITDILLKRSVINRYNAIVLQPTSSLLPSNQVMTGIGLTFRL